MQKTVVAVALGLAMTIGLMGRASAQLEVQVGYADDLRPSPFFPIPWVGDSNVIALADHDGGWDTGAVRLINNGTTALTLTAFNVDGFGDGTNFDIWNGTGTNHIGSGIVFNPGQSVILAQNNGENFDSSDDEGGNPSALPMVHVTIAELNGGLSQSFIDTAQVLNTEGTDHLAQAGLNESHAWRDIGTFGGQSGVPEPGTFALLAGLSISGAGILLRRRK